MKHWLLSAALIAFAIWATAGVTRAEGQTDTLREDRVIALNELRELSELNLVGELIPRGRSLTAKGATLENSGEARALVARSLHAAGEESEALALLAGGELSPIEQPWIDLERVRIHLQLDELESALNQLTRETPGEPGKRVLRHPEIPDSWLLLARTHARAGDLRSAAPAAQQFLKRAALHPGAPSAWHILASAALALRDGERANRFLARAREIEEWHAIFSARRLQLRRNPNDPLPRLGLGMAWMQVSQYDQALGEFNTLVADHPSYSRGWFHLGEAYRLKGDLSTAYRAYERAVETDSSQHLARYNLAIIDLMEARSEKAQLGLELLMSIAEVESDPRFAEAHLQLAKLYEAAGDLEGARRENARYRELVPENE